ncbi:uncharacterized protein FIBRA_01095 [Fibroporia radiculosa]|uniref:Matrin-type domain-containing protein n=1 Tax=Fibroporia radiculosa TaxID=599839 RepID=J4HSR5_9APHY|nr:uncharacterized protein FIBRA_01095 [Fibroporia radiculosa]CCL99082.1 predicted protein [Fibroporia radiculosa]
MSEYWVSHKKYFCKYCNIYIADDAPSRKQHESGLRHKGNVERFVRGLYKEGERRKQDREEEKRDMARIEQAANAAFARDVGAGLVRPGSGSSTPVASGSATTRQPEKKPSNPYANYSTAESLGYTDPDAERLEAEAARRRTQGVAGDWEVVTVAESSTATERDAPATLPNGELGKKREAEQPLDEDDTRRFKLRRKTLGAGLGEIYDPGFIPIKIKKKEESVDILLSPSDDGQNAATGSGATALPKWSSRGWKKPGESSAETTVEMNGEQEEPGQAEAALQDPGPQIIEDKASAPTTAEIPSLKEETAAVKEEDAAVKTEVPPEAIPAPGGGLFRKRKLPAGGVGGRGRR